MIHTSQPSVHMLPNSGISGCLVMPPLKSMSNPNPGFCPDRVIQSRQSQQKQLWRKNQRERALLICGIVPSFSAISWHTGHKARKLSSSDSGLACACERVYQWEVADSESWGRNNKNSGFSRHMQLCMHLVSSKSVHLDAPGTWDHEWQTSKISWRSASAFWNLLPQLFFFGRGGLCRFNSVSWINFFLYFPKLASGLLIQHWCVWDTHQD